MTDGPIQRVTTVQSRPRPTGGARAAGWWVARGAGVWLGLGSLMWTHAAVPDVGARAEAGAALFSDGAVHRVEIRLGAAERASLRGHPRRHVPVAVRWGDTVVSNVAARLKGSTGSFRPVEDRPSWTLDFGRWDPGRTWDGLERVQLNNSVEDPGCLNEGLGSAVFRSAGIPAPRVAHALVTVNGRECGLYVLKEGYAEAFLAAHFDRADGALYDNDLGSDIDQPLHRCRGGSNGDAEGLAKLLAAVRQPDPAQRWPQLGEILDVDRFLSFVALEVMLGHRDGYSLARNNFRIYDDPGSGRFVFLPDGMDQLLGPASLPWRPRMSGLVAAGVLATPEGSARYQARFRELFDQVFRPGHLEAWIDGQVAALRPNLPSTESRRVAKEAVMLKGRLVDRAEALRGQWAEPGPGLLEWAGDRASLAEADWQEVDAATAARMERIPAPDGVPSLHIVAGASTGASWRTRVRVGPGAYRFEGRCRVAGVRGRPGARNPGAGLRVSGQARPAGALVGETGWRELGARFSVEPGAGPEGVELVCELAAGGGEVWVDLASLRLIRDRGGARWETAGIDP